MPPDLDVAAKIGRSLDESVDGLYLVASVEVLGAEVPERELTEELGPTFACTIGAPVVCWIRPPEPHRPLPVFLTGFLCSSPSGAIVLSGEHRAHRWFTARDRDRIAFAPGYLGAIDAFLAQLRSPRE